MDTGTRRWILKPCSSQRFHQVFQQKGFMVDDRHTAEKRFASCVQFGLSMILQEYIPGAPAAHVFVDGFIDQSGIVRAWLARRRLRRYPPDMGNSSSGVSIPIGELRDYVVRLEELLVSLQYRGIFSAEFKHDRADGQYKLLEVNCRPYWYVDFARRCGVNLCLMAYRDALGLPVATLNDYRVGAHFGFAAIELRALIDEYKRGALSRPGLAAGLVGLARLPFRPDDPLPAVFRVAKSPRKRVRSV